MNRRHFLGLLGAAAAGVAVDPDFLQWEPGAKAYFDMGRGREWAAVWFRRGDVIEIAGRYVMNPTTGLIVPGVQQQFVVTADVYADGPEIRVDMWPQFAIPKPRAKDVRLLPGNWSRHPAVYTARVHA